MAENLTASVSGLAKLHWRNHVAENLTASVSGLAKLHWRNHVAENLTASFILYVIIIKWIMYVQDNIELSSMS